MEFNEKALIGQAILVPDIVLTVCTREGLSEEHFGNPTAARAYAAILSAWSNSAEVDATLIGDERFVSECRALCPVTDLERCISNIKNASSNAKLRDRLLYEANGIELNQESEHSEILSRIQKAVDSFGTVADKERAFCEVAEEEAERIIAGTLQDGLVPWPIEFFNDRIGKLAQEYIFISARPSVGKTAFILAWLLALAQSKMPALLLSLESGLRTLSHRAIGHLSGVSMQRFKNGRMLDEDVGLVRNAVKLMADVKPAIRHGVYTMERIYSLARAEKKRGLRILMIDNLKHIKASRKYNSRVDQFADYSAQLKWLRDELEIPVVVLHHLNRTMEIAMSDDIERDADIAITMTENEPRSVKPCKENNWQERCIVDIEITKARDARCGLLTVEFLKNIQRFEPI